MMWLRRRYVAHQDYYLSAAVLELLERAAQIYTGGFSGSSCVN
jgi:hypothetical protein